MANLEAPLLPGDTPHDPKKLKSTFEKLAVQVERLEAQSASAGSAQTKRITRATTRAYTIDAESSLDVLIAQKKNESLWQIWRHQNDNMEVLNELKAFNAKYVEFQKEMREANIAKTLELLMKFSKMCTATGRFHSHLIAMFAQVVDGHFDPVPSEAMLATVRANFTKINSTLNGLETPQEPLVKQQGPVLKVLAEGFNTLLKDLGFTPAFQHSGVSPHNIPCPILRWWLVALFDSARHGKYYFAIRTDWVVHEMMELKHMKWAHLGWSVTNWISHGHMDASVVQGHADEAILFDDLALTVMPQFWGKLVEYQGVLEVKLGNVVALQQKLMATSVTAVISLAQVAGKYYEKQKEED